VILRYGFEVEPVLWQIVSLAGGVLDGGGVAAAAGHAPVPTTIASPVCLRCARRTRPAVVFGAAIARPETVIRRHWFVADAVL
jgi:hypothetical protein